MIRFVTLSMSICVAACTEAAPETPRTAPLAADEVRLLAADLDPARAATSAQGNWAGGRRHVLGVYGYAAITPGLVPVTEGLPVRYIQGTSDFWKTPQDADFNRKADAYAKAYNTEISRLAAAQQ